MKKTNIIQTKNNMEKWKPKSIEQLTEEIEAMMDREVMDSAKVKVSLKMSKEDSEIWDDLKL
jgi:hypothetical protein